MTKLTVAFRNFCERTYKHGLRTARHFDLELYQPPVETACVLGYDCEHTDNKLFYPERTFVS